MCRVGINSDPLGRHGNGKRHHNSRYSQNWKRTFFETQATLRTRKQNHSHKRDPSIETIQQPGKSQTEYHRNPYQRSNGRPSDDYSSRFGFGSSTTNTVLDKRK
ncbi:MAG: hypothetical protein DMG78_12850 [Acidobacteria bacterium]|nr:MAG: hypothetical protein DMG78_12850 [Acidobacteriota bacterium]